jgi:hypothetical protein
VNFIQNEFEDYVPPFVRRNTNTMSETSETSDVSEISDISATSSKDTIITTSTEKKNEKITPENVGEKPAKKKGRPRTKGVVETKSVKKIEETESSEGCSVKGCGAPDTVEDSSDDFGITIDQLQDHLNNAISMSVVENPA